MAKVILGSDRTPPATAPVFLTPAYTTGALEVPGVLTVQYVVQNSTGETFEWYRANDANGTGETQITMPSSPTYDTQQGDQYISCTVRATNNTAPESSVAPYRGVVDPVGQPGDPELPRANLNTTIDPAYDRPADIPVSNGGDLQAAINSAVAGQIVELEAGATFTGNFVLPNKAGTEWIYIRSSAHASLPAPGTRVGPADAINMAKLRTNNVDSACRVDWQAHNYRLIGIDLDAETTTNAIVLCGYNSSINPASLSANMPDEIIFDRCYIHGEPAKEVGFGMISATDRLGVVDSTISEIHDDDVNSIGLHLAWGHGPTAITNNFIEASRHNFFMGGSELGTQSPDVYPTDVTIRGNHFYKNPAWNGVWAVYNNNEHKFCQRVLFEGNIFDHSWIGGHEGELIEIHARSGDNAHMTFRKNVFRHGDLGAETASPVNKTRSILFADNLFYDITWRFFVTQKGSGGASQDLIYRHNTVHGTASGLYYFGANSLAIEGVKWIDNISSWGSYGFFGDGAGFGWTAVDAFTDPYIFDNNLLITAPTQTDNANYGNWMYAATDADVGFTNPAPNSVADFKLMPGSTHAAGGAEDATDSKDMGADIDAIMIATAGTISGDWT